MGMVPCRRGTAWACALGLSAWGGGWPVADVPDKEGARPSSRPATERTGAVTGRITTTSKRALPEMVVYLEPLDPQRRFAPTSQPAVISQKGAKFSPALLVISAGQSVEFRNDEDRPIEHNVFSRSGVQPFDLGLYRPGVSKAVTFHHPGVVRLYCSIHRYMDGVIYVCPTPFFACLGRDGRYVIEGVPAGEYRIKTWQRRRRFREQSDRVVVTAGKASTIDFEMSRK